MGWYGSLLRVRRDLMQPFGRDYRSVAASHQRTTGDVTPDFLDDVVEGQVPKVDQSLAEKTIQGLLSTAAVIRQAEVERLPYQGGYSLNVYTTFSKASGSFSAATLGATLARPLVGDTSQFIPRTLGQIVAGVQQTGATVTLLEAYP